MNWKFWKQTDAASPPKSVKQSKPRQLPDRVGIYLVTELKQDPDWVWSLKAVMAPNTGSKSSRSIRIFDPVESQRQGLIVTGFDFLETHMQVVLFAGWYDKNSGIVHIEKINRQAA
jgi:hypothetical protein